MTSDNAPSCPHRPFSRQPYRDCRGRPADKTDAGAVQGRRRVFGAEVMLLKRRLFSAISWRLEARAAALPATDGSLVRHRCGHLMRWAGAHDSLPDIHNRAAILCFHSVTGHRPDPDVECDALDVRDFRKLLRVLRRSFRVISLAQLVQSIREQIPPPAKSIVITFDDGYANNHTVAAEELSAMRMPWSEFLPAMLIETAARQWIDDVRVLIHRGSRRHLSFCWDGRKVEFDLGTRQRRHEAVRRFQQLCRYLPDDLRMAQLADLYSLYSKDELEGLRARYPSFSPMGWDQVRELTSAGVDVGSHSLTHTALAPQSPEVIRREILTARDLLQRRIGEHSPHFSYPYGKLAAISEESERLLAEVGYHCGLTLEQDVVNCAQANLLQLPRLIVSAQVGRMLFSLWQRFIR